MSIFGNDSKPQVEGGDVAVPVVAVETPVIEVAQGTKEAPGKCPTCGRDTVNS